MKFASYHQLKEAVLKDFIVIDPDDYTEEEEHQIALWLIEASQEFLTEEKMLNMSEDDLEWYGFKNESVLNKIISESPEEYTIKGKKIFGKEIITYPEFSIIKEENKNNYYRIMK